MASFQAKPERDWLRMRLKKKIYHSHQFQPDPEEGIPTKSLKNAKK